MRKIFWTQRRLEALSRTALTLFQGFLLAGAIGGVFGKIPSILIKGLFVAVTVIFFWIGILFSDWPKEGGN